MKSDWKALILVLSLTGFAILFNLSIAEKEKVLQNGQLVLLEMAPIDPRAPLQGDYMQLNYKATAGISLDSIPNRGYCILRPIGSNVFENVRYQANKAPIGKNELALRYTTDRHQIHLGSSVFFFQEGKAELYDSAHYAGMRIDDNGSGILVGLFDQNKKLIP